jgi:putative membrane protein
VTGSRFLAFNAGLNTLTAVLLTLGYLAVRRKKIPLHRVLMGSASFTALCFLIGYIVHHLQAGITRFTGVGAARFLYLLLLSTHTVAAVVLLPLVVVTLTLALRGRFEQHRRLARWTWPIWMYVSVTGVIIYLVLYHFS